MKKIILISLICFAKFCFAQNSEINKLTKDFLLEPRTENQTFVLEIKSSSFEKKDEIFNRKYTQETYFYDNKIIAEIETSRIIPEEIFFYSTVLWRIESLKIFSREIKLKYGLNIGDKIEQFKKILGENNFVKIEKDKYKIEINETGRTNEMFLETNKNNEVITIELKSFKS
jgi:hypothetical protein